MARRKSKAGGGYVLRVIDRRPNEFVSERVAKSLRIPVAELGTLDNVRDVYLVKDGQCALHHADMQIASVLELWLWWTNHGHATEYDFGSNDPTRRFPSGIPGV